MIFVQFDAVYLEKLRTGDTETERHFTTYFGELLFLKLRNRVRSLELVEDIRQETLLRVMSIVRGRGVEHPERLGAFVHAVCNNVMLEQLRREGRTVPMSPDGPEPVDDRIDLDSPIIGDETKVMVAQVLDALPGKDRSLLRMIFLDELPKEEICRLLEVDADYLRVLLHRAKNRFRVEFEKRAAATPARKASHP